MKLNDFGNILFLDIETVSNYASYDSLSNDEKALWQKKARKFTKGELCIDPELLKESYESKAGIFSEFAKIVCITVAFLTIEDKSITKMRLKSFYGHDEAVLLADFCDLLNQHYYDAKKHFLSGHNIKEFDIPFICRRLIINKMELPKLLNIRGKKPWQIDYLLDTLEMWRFGDYKNYTSLNLLAYVLGIPSPKEDIDGSMVSVVYWNEDNLERIMQYCERDVKTTVQVLLRMSSQNMVDDKNVESITKEN